jgi:hypothetical protein
MDVAHIRRSPRTSFGASDQSRFTATKTQYKHGGFHRYLKQRFRYIIPTTEDLPAAAKRNLRALQSLPQRDLA